MSTHDHDPRRRATLRDHRGRDTPVAARARGSPAPTRGSARSSPTTWPASGRRGRRLARRRVENVRPAADGPGHRRPALRAGDLRGHEGLPARRRLGLDVPPARPTPPGSRARAQPAGPAGAVRGGLPRSLEALVAADLDWVPSGEETSLYLRPFMFASEAFLGVRPSLEAEFLVIASPVGPYFAGGVQAGVHLGRRGVPPRGRRRHRRRQVRRQLRREPLPQQRGHEQGFDQVCLPRRRRPARSSRSSAG